MLGSDFCHPMLIVAKRKSVAPFFEADALSLPLASASVDLITVAFGFRNLANYEAGLVELKRSLRPGGTLAILEFSQPPNPAFRSLYGFYSSQVLPRIGSLISGSKDAYTYLPESVRKFPDAEGLAAKMKNAGYRDVSFELFTFGIVALHLGIA
ncbi:MAG: class I SAM-dependent methyltransferase [Bryobacteraceae bacterium]